MNLDCKVFNLTTHSQYLFIRKKHYTTSLEANLGIFGWLTRKLVLFQRAVKIYELDTLQRLTASELQEESGVIGLENVDFKEVLNMVSSGKYASFDEVIVNADTPDELLEKFSKEHLHADDEVRYFVAGNSIFDVRGSKDQWIRIEVSEKDFITVPQNLYHRFFTPQKQAKALRLFTGQDGWVPVYR
jgi:cupin superfamily acireductone dioxygenase involved in methionine salvage